MREIKLASNKGIALIDDEDYQRVSVLYWCLNSSGYALANFSGENVLLHRFILWFPDHMIDHKDGNKLNCQKNNLRSATKGQNIANSCKRATCSSIFKGVSFHKRDRVWTAHIQNRHIGIFETEIEAAEAYNQKALQIFGEFAKLNNLGEIEIK